jgi:hypothetical protein
MGAPRKYSEERFAGTFVKPPDGHGVATAQVPSPSLDSALGEEESRRKGDMPC